VSLAGMGAARVWVEAGNVWLGGNYKFCAIMHQGRPEGGQEGPLPPVPPPAG